MTEATDGISRGKDNAALEDEVQVTLTTIEGDVKYADPEEWGDLEDDRKAQEAAAGPLRLEVGEIRHEGTPEEIKGPGPQWANYIEGDA